jgi:2,3-bisphosphoglycerate-independent phosphoglycerate mutase
VAEIGGVLVVTADHGNIEEITYEDGSPKTSHTTNKVPFTVWGAEVKLLRGNYGLANVAATVAELLGVAPDAGWQPSLIGKVD